jgi:hypothetical protein
VDVGKTHPELGRYWHARSTTAWSSEFGVAFRLQLPQERASVADIDFDFEEYS